MSVRDSVVLAAEVRMRPIVITALALVIGSMVLLTDPIFQGMAVSLLFGSLIATFLTLVVIPLGCLSAQSQFCRLSPECGAPAGGMPPRGGVPPAGGVPPTGGMPPSGGIPPSGGGAPTPGRPMRLAKRGELPEGGVGSRSGPRLPRRWRQSSVARRKLHPVLVRRVWSSASSLRLPPWKRRRQHRSRQRPSAAPDEAGGVGSAGAAASGRGCVPCRRSRGRPPKLLKRADVAPPAPGPEAAAEVPAGRRGWQGSLRNLRSRRPLLSRRPPWKRRLHRQFHPRPCRAGRSDWSRGSRKRNSTAGFGRAGRAGTAGSAAPASCHCADSSAAAEEDGGGPGHAQGRCQGSDAAGRGGGRGAARAQVRRPPPAGHGTGRSEAGYDEEWRQAAEPPTQDKLSALQTGKKKLRGIRIIPI